MRTKKTPKRSLVIAALFVSSGLVAACAGPATTVAPQSPVATQPPPATQPPAPTEPLQAPPPIETVDFWIAATSDEEGVFNGQIEQFMQQNPDVEVTLTSMPYSNFNEALLTAIESGQPPDVALLSYNHVVDFQTRELLEPLNGRIGVDDFLTDAVDSNTINDQLYGLPLLRSACLPQYRNLALFTASQYQDAALSLMDFLTQPEQQEQNFNDLSMYPTRGSVYGTLELSCPEVEAIRLQPEAVQTTIDRVASSAEILTPVLQGQVLNPYEATAVTLEEGGEILAVASAVTDPVPLQDIDKRLEEGLVVGALSVDADEGLTLKDSSGNTQIIDPGDYVTLWRKDPGAEEPKFYLVTPDGNEIEVTVAAFESMDAPVGPPTVEVLSGSHRFCWCIDGACGCIPLPHLF